MTSRVDREPRGRDRRRRRRRLIVFGVFLLAAGSCAWYRATQRSRVQWQQPGGRVHDGALHARLVGAAGSPIVLLHGFLGSSLSWGAEFDSLGSRHRVIVPDLLGFADSPKPPSRYTLDDHVAAVVALLTELGIDEPVIVVGHSFGAVVGLRLAITHPGSVSGVVALSPPLYPNPRESRRRMAAGDPMGGLLLLDSPLAHRSCIWFHEHPAMAAGLVRLWRPDLPPPIARDSARHTWASYSGTLEGLLAAGNGAELIRPITAPTRIVAGENDGVVDLPYLRLLERVSSAVTVQVVPGAGHDLPLTHPKLCLRELAALETAVARGRG